MQIQQKFDDEFDSENLFQDDGEDLDDNDDESDSDRSDAEIVGRKRYRSSSQDSKDSLPPMSKYQKK